MAGKELVQATLDATGRTDLVSTLSEDEGTEDEDDEEEEQQSDEECQEDTEISRAQHVCTLTCL